MPRDTTSIFDSGAVIVPDFVTPAEEARILLRIGDAPWLTELRRRVQHYGYRYRLPRRFGSRPLPAPRRSPAGPTAMADRLRPHFGGALPVQCIVNEYRPGQGIGMHADHRDFGPAVGSLSLGADWPMRFRPRATRPYAERRHARRRGRDCSPDARSWCSPAQPDIDGCMASTGPTAHARPRRASPPRSAPSPG